MLRKGKMSVSLSLRVAAFAGGLLVAGLAWNGLSRYFAARHADEIIPVSEHSQQLQASQPKGFYPVNANISKTSDHA
jgi:hypothetical protein